MGMNLNIEDKNPHLHINYNQLDMNCKLKIFFHKMFAMVKFLCINHCKDKNNFDIINNFYQLDIFSIHYRIIYISELLDHNMS